MLYAILSDIHGNFPALKAVEEDARSMADSEGANVKYVCLGDVVDYGPQPNECVKWVRDNVEVFVSGNHEDAALDHKLPVDINQEYWPATLWTRLMLRGEHKQWLEDQKQGEKEKEPGLKTNGLGSFAICHSSLRHAHHMQRIDTIPVYEREWTALDSLKTFALFGHTHHQMYFQGGVENSSMFFATSEEQKRKINYRELMLKDKSMSAPSKWALAAIDAWLRLPPNLGMFINPGSVGQPRRHGKLKEVSRDGAGDEPHAAYALIRQKGSDHHVMFRQVRYAVQDTIGLINALMVLPRAGGNPHSGNVILPNGAAAEFTDETTEQMRELRDAYQLALATLPQPELDPDGSDLWGRLREAYETLPEKLPETRKKLVETLLHP